jgi:TetR/AcrR family transcriptional repressor of nem operon
VSPAVPGVPGRRTTARGAATRDRIVSAAADLIYQRGVGAVTLDDVRGATATSKSQFYKHFSGKPELIGAVISHSAAQVLARERQRLEHFDSIHTLRSWRDALVEAVALQGGAYGCALGSMIIQLSDHDEQARCALSQHLASWEGLLVAGLRRMQAAGTPQPTADPEALATGLIGALQGGYLLAQANRDAAAMGTALDMALAHVESLSRDGYVTYLPALREIAGRGAAVKSGRQLRKSMLRGCGVVAGHGGRQ